MPPSHHLWGFPGGSDGKESVCNAGDSGSIPELGRSPREGNGNPLQYSCLENAMNRGAWWATVHGVAKSWTWLSDSHTHTHTHTHTHHLWIIPLEFFLSIIHLFRWSASVVAQTVKNPPAMWETWVQSLGWGDPLEEGVATHSSILA